LVTALRELGATVTELPFVHGAFDSVFMKDSAVLVRRPGDDAARALVARPRFKERQAEQERRTRALTASGVRVLGTSRAYLEGGDVVVLPGAHGAFLGFGFRSVPQASSDLEDLLGAEVTCLELSDRRLYHLDMALTVLDDGTALVCQEALSRSSLRAIASHHAVREVLHVPFNEALRFGANLVQVGRAIVMAGDAPATEAALGARGYHVVRVRLDEFHLAGGSAACLTARVHHSLTTPVSVVLEASGGLVNPVMGLRQDSATVA
jgi:N-dimethylarginine dimethylaminohydrolase